MISSKPFELMYALESSHTVVPTNQMVVVIFQSMDGVLILLWNTTLPTVMEVTIPQLDLNIQVLLLLMVVPMVFILVFEPMNHLLKVLQPLINIGPYELLVELEEQ